MDPARLVEALCQMFGKHASAELTKLVRSATARQIKTDRSAVFSEGVSFQDFLVWARRQRVSEYNKWKDTFVKFDEDDSGLIDSMELCNVLRSLGYTPLKC